MERSQNFGVAGKATEIRPARPRIVVLDAATFGDASLERFAACWDCTIHPVTHPGELAPRLQGHSVAITNKVAFNRAVLDSPQARDLKLIAVAATGTDIIDLETARRAGVRVCNVPGYATHSVAQFTLALVLQLATRVCQYRSAARRGDWQRSPIFTLLEYPAIELNGKKLGIVGYGGIGRTVAAMARGFGLEVLIGAKAGHSGPLPADRLPLEILFREADIITLHCPLTPETKNLINRQSLAWMKPSAFLINTARGALVDEEALLQALREKRLGGAALDVLVQEPPRPGQPLLEAAGEMGNLIITPHTAWSAREARERLLREVAENIRAFVAGDRRNIVV